MIFLLDVSSHLFLFYRQHLHPFFLNAFIDEVVLEVVSDVLEFPLDDRWHVLSQ